MHTRTLSAAAIWEEEQDVTVKRRLSENHFGDGEEEVVAGSSGL